MINIFPEQHEFSNERSTVTIFCGVLGSALKSIVNLQILVPLTVSAMNTYYQSWKAVKN